MKKIKFLVELEKGLLSEDEKRNLNVQGISAEHYIDMNRCIGFCPVNKRQSLGSCYVYYKISESEIKKMIRRRVGLIVNNIDTIYINDYYLTNNAEKKTFLIDVIKILRKLQSGAQNVDNGND